MLLETRRELAGSVSGIYASYLRNCNGLSYGHFGSIKERILDYWALLCTL